MCVWYYLILYAKLNKAAVQHSSTNFTANFDLTEAARRFDKWTKWTLVKSCQSLSHFTPTSSTLLDGLLEANETLRTFRSDGLTEDNESNGQQTVLYCCFFVSWASIETRSCHKTLVRLRFFSSKLRKVFKSEVETWNNSGAQSDAMLTDTNHLPRANKSRWRHNLHSPETRDVDHEDRPREGTECPGSKSTSWNNPNVDITKDLKFIEISSVL